MSGYKNCILEIDLTRGSIGKSEISREILRECIGGSGIAARLFLERGNAGVEPFSERNNLFIMTGPLTGTTFPGSGRFIAASRSPLTGLWGESSCGGDFGPELKAAGYDGIAITGASQKPTYLFIEDDKVQLCDASDIWGIDTVQTTEWLRLRHQGDRKAKVLAIGKAGENLVRFANIMNGGDALGRCGLGAVMGSKKLKAIAVKGSAKAWRPQDSEYDSFMESLNIVRKDSEVVKSYHDLGTNAAMIIGRKPGDIPVRNWAAGDSNPYAKPLLPFVMNEKYFVRHGSCVACPVGCKKFARVNEGPYKVEECPSPEYESFASFGPMLMIGGKPRDMEAIIKINDMCNRYGMDVISCGAVIAFIFECYEKGLITKEDTGGLELGWGDADLVIELVEKIASVKGLGKVLAQGSRIAAERIGKGSKDYTAEVKGLDLPMHDPRAYHGIGLAYATSIRGACHLSNLVYWIERNRAVYPELGLAAEGGSYERFGPKGKAEMTVLCEDFAMVINDAPLCQFVFTWLKAADLLYMLRTATGFDYDLDELRRCGERTWYLKRCLNNIMGARAGDDRLPKKVMTPLSEGGTEGTVPDMETMLGEYYRLREFDSAGVPTVGKLKELGLYDLLKERYDSIFK